MAPKHQTLGCRVGVRRCQRTGTKRHCQAPWPRKDAADRQCAIIASQVTLVVENLPANARGMGSISRLGRAPGKRKWQPSPVLLPGGSRGQRSLVGRSPWGHRESDITHRPHIIAGWCECWLPPVGSLKTGWMSHKGTSCVSAWKPVTWTLSQREREILSPQGLGEEFPNSQLHRSGMTRSRPFSDQISSLSTFLSGVWILGHICHWDGSGDLFSDFENLIWFELRDFQASLGSLHTF